MHLSCCKTTSASHQRNKFDYLGIMRQLSPETEMELWYYPMILSVLGIFIAVALTQRNSNVSMFNKQLNETRVRVQTSTTKSMNTGGGQESY